MASGLVLTKRTDVEHQAPTKAVRTINHLWAEVGNLWYQVRDYADQWSKAERKRVKLDELLEDPELTAEYPYDSTERIEAERQCRFYKSDAKEAIESFTRYAKSFAVKAEDLPNIDRRSNFSQMVAYNSDSPTFVLVKRDSQLLKLPIWKELIDILETMPEEEKCPCPF